MTTFGVNARRLFLICFPKSSRTFILSYLNLRTANCELVKPCLNLTNPASFPDAAIYPPLLTVKSLRFQNCTRKSVHEIPVDLFWQTSRFCVTASLTLGLYSIIHISLPEIFELPAAKILFQCHTHTV